MLFSPEGEDNEEHDVELAIIHQPEDEHSSQSQIITELEVPRHDETDQLFEVMDDLERPVLEQMQTGRPVGPHLFDEVPRRPRRQWRVRRLPDGAELNHQKPCMAQCYLFARSLLWRFVLFIGGVVSLPIGVVVVALYILILPIVFLFILCWKKTCENSLATTKAHISMVFAYFILGPITLFVLCFFKQL